MTDPAALEQAIARSRQVTETVAITYLGQVGFLFQHRGFAVLIDPFLSGDAAEPGPWRRNYAPPVAPERLTHIDVVLCTHDHADHTDPATLTAIASASPDAVFVGPRKSADIMVRAGLDAARVRTANAGASLPFGSLVVEPLAMAHEDYEQDADGYYTHLGYVLRWAGRTFFHAGDTTPQPQLSRDLEGHRIDVGFLPINGRDDARRQQNIVGNMDSAEAVAFAVRHQFGLLVPTHFDLYSINGASLPDFMKEAEISDVKPRFKLFRPGEQMFYPVA